MRVLDYDRMDKAEQSRYLSLLVEGIQRVLIAHGRTTDAIKIKRLFYYGGRQQFEDNLKTMRAANSQRLQIEDVFCVTIRWNGILRVPSGFYEVGNNFKR